LQENEYTLKSEEDRLLSMDKDLLAKVTFMEEFLEALAVCENRVDRDRERERVSIGFVLLYI
jgi:hypothetical protein